MTVLIQYTGPDARHSDGVDVGPTFIHLDLNGEAVEVPDDLAKALLTEQPGAFQAAKKTKTDSNKENDK